MALPLGHTPGALRALATMHTGDLVILAMVCRLAGRAALDEGKSALGAEVMADARRMEAEVSRRAYACALARGDVHG